MNTSIRRATPDSEAIASSEDERPWPAAPAFGSLPHKENSVPGLGGGIWSTQKRGSFKMEKAAQRNAAREARLGAPGQPRSGLRNDATPSPSASEGSAALPFQIPLLPAPKAGRSLSHSQGQREYPPVSGAHSTQADHAPALPLGLLAEEVDTESESDLGGGLTHTTSHPPIGTLHRTATYPATYDAYYSATNGKEHGESVVGAQGGSQEHRRLDTAFSHLSLASEHQQRSQWQTHLGWDDVPNINESRRHSLADIPTRRGSFAGATEHWSENPHLPANGHHAVYGQQQYNNSTTPRIEHDTRTASSEDDQNMLSQRFNELRAQAAGMAPQAASPAVETLPQSYRLHPITLSAQERSEQGARGPAFMGAPPNQQFTLPHRARKQLFIVSFKCSRVDVFYLYDNTGLAIKEGDIVIVEADRGQDLGTVQHADVTEQDARVYKRRYHEEQYKWLMMFSKNNNQGSVNPNAQVYGEDNRGTNTAGPSNWAQPQATAVGFARASFSSLKPKAIKRLANNHEIRMLGEKEGNEAKAKRACQGKVILLHLDMEILDAEWQWDFQKLIFYYYADHYINFKDLITELYRIYKTRIWLSAINPASFSQQALGAPPSGIGPGAVTLADAGGDLMGSYATLVDPDPYGAVPPYQVGYDTYTPNYPAIPGVINSFGPATTNPYGLTLGNTQVTASGTIGAMGYGSGDVTPAGGFPNAAPAPDYGRYGGFGGQALTQINTAYDARNLPGTTTGNQASNIQGMPMNNTNNNPIGRTMMNPTASNFQGTPMSSNFAATTPMNPYGNLQGTTLAGPNLGMTPSSSTTPQYDYGEISRIQYWQDFQRRGTEYHRAQAQGQARGQAPPQGSAAIPVPVPGRRQPLPPPRHPASGSHRWLDEATTDWPTNRQPRDFAAGPPAGARPTPHDFTREEFTPGDIPPFSQRLGQRLGEARAQDPAATPTTASGQDFGVGRLSLGGSNQASTVPRPTQLQSPQATLGSPPQIRFGATGDNTARTGMMETFLDSLQSPEDKHADEMSRER